SVTRLRAARSRSLAVSGARAFSSCWPACLTEVARSFRPDGPTGPRIKVAAAPRAEMTAPARACLAASAICFSCVISSTLSTAGPTDRRSRRATVQLTLAILDPPDPPPKPSAPQLAPIPWERIDAEARRAALDLLARLIARIL